MKNLRSKFEHFCFRHRNKGIPNLMLLLVIGNAIVYIVNLVDPSNLLYSVLSFNRSAILHGQVWRLFSYVLLDMSSRSILYAIIFAVLYSQLGRALENAWGRLRFNLFYLSGILFLDIAGFLLNAPTYATTLNLSLFLTYATLYPETQFLILFIIPLKARWLGIFNLALYLVQLLSITQFPYNLFPLFALANYFLFLGKDFVNIFPVSWRINASRLKPKPHKTRSNKSVPFPTAGSYTATTTRPEAPYMHKCTVCGRTDVTNPELEFRYCSKCKGYYCYCADHINNHTHIQ